MPYLTETVLIEDSVQCTLNLYSDVQYLRILVCRASYCALACIIFNLFPRADTYSLLTLYIFVLFTRLPVSERVMGHDETSEGSIWYKYETSTYL